MKIKLKAKSKTIKTASIAFLILGVVYLGVRYLAKTIIHTDKVCHENKCFVVEIADTEEERHHGLMDREFLAKDKGMLFVFTGKEQKYAFWMKNTLIPLDMIRINSGLNIVDIQTAQPCTSNICETYVPQGDATYVLELNAGIADEYNMHIGDRIEIK